MSIKYLVIRIMAGEVGAAAAESGVRLQWGCYTSASTLVSPGEGDWAALDAYLSNEFDTEQLAAMQAIALAPAEHVLLTSASVPAKNHSQRIQALPFVVEEQLIGDIDAMHFAPGTSKGPDD